MTKICPQCGERYNWYEAECPVCRVPLQDAPDEHQPDLKLTVVFHTTEPGLVPLATLALEQRGIEYFTRLEGRDSMSAGGVAVRGEASDAPVEILVREEEAATARELLEDLETGETSPAPPAAHPATASGGATPADASVDLVDLETQRSVGHITDDDLAWLDSQLEKESQDDQDYFFDAATLDMLESAGGRSTLVAMLRGALGSRAGMDIRWSRRE